MRRYVVNSTLPPFSSVLHQHSTSPEVFDREKALLRSIFDDAPSFMCALSGPDHVFELINRVYRDFVGRKNYEIVGRPLREVLPELVDQGLVAALDEVYRSGRPFIAKELPIHLRETEHSPEATFYVDVLCRPRTDAWGITKGVLVHGTDVTDVKRKEQELEAQKSALEQNERRFKSLVYANSQVVWIEDADGSMRDVLGDWQDLTGHSPEEVPENDWTNLVHADDLRRFRRQMKAQRGKTEAIESELRLQSADGGYRWMRSRRVPVFAENGTLLEWVGSLTDIDDRKRAEMALYESEARYRTIVDTAHEGVWLIDPAAHTTFVNARMAHILGRSSADLLGTSYFDLVDAADLREAHTQLETRREGLSAVYDLRVRRSDGEIRWVTISASPFYDDEGHFAGSLGMVTDITERKNTEIELRRAKEVAERASRLKTAFLTNMSHEIRTPLTTILGCSEMIAEEVTGEARAMADSVRDAGERLLTTLDSVLMLAQLESGAFRLSPTRVNVVDIVEGSLPAYERRAERKGLSLRLESDIPVIPAILDADALGRVVGVLVDNAVKFTESGGVSVHLSAEKDGTHVRVRDTGIGIDPEFLPRIFGDFEQESAGVARTYEGMGVGLSICVRLVKLLGGTIRVSSERDEGTEVTVVLP